MRGPIRRPRAPSSTGGGSSAASREVKTDVDVTEADIASANLILWGDSTTNKVLARLADRLPIAWNRERIKAGDRTFSSDNHGLILIARTRSTRVGMWS